MYVARRSIGKAATAITGAGLTQATGFRPTASSGLETMQSDEVAVPVSSNGWPIINDLDMVGQIGRIRIDGTGLSLGLRRGAPEVLLGRILGRFHYEVADLTESVPRGYDMAVTARTDPESNHSSGTEIDLYLGPRASLRDVENSAGALRALLSEFRGLVGVRGELSEFTPVHVYIDVPPADQRIEVLAADLRARSKDPKLRPGKLLVS